MHCGWSFGERHRLCACICNGNFVALRRIGELKVEVSFMLESRVARMFLGCKVF